MRRVLLIVGGIIIVLAVVPMALAVLRDPEGFKREVAKEAAARDAAAPAPLALNVKLVNPQYLRRDLTLEASFTVDNKNTSAVKDITVHCTHFGKSGTAIDSSTRTIYDRFKPGQTRVNGFDMGFLHDQAVSHACEVIRAVQG